MFTKIAGMFHSISGNSCTFLSSTVYWGSIWFIEPRLFRGNSWLWIWKWFQRILNTAKAKCKRTVCAPCPALSRRSGRDSASLHVPHALRSPNEVVGIPLCSICLALRPAPWALPTKWSGFRFAPCALRPAPCASKTSGFISVFNKLWDYILPANLPTFAVL